MSGSNARRTAMRIWNIGWTHISVKHGQAMEPSLSSRCHQRRRVNMLRRIIFDGSLMVHMYIPDGTGCPLKSVQFHVSIYTPGAVTVASQEKIVAPRRSETVMVNRVADRHREWKVRMDVQGFGYNTSSRFGTCLQCSCAPMPVGMSVPFSSERMMFRSRDCCVRPDNIPSRYRPALRGGPERV